MNCKTSSRASSAGRQVCRAAGPGARGPDARACWFGSRRRRRAQAGFTLAEVLAAMLFMAIVIPVAVAGLRLASLAGEVGARKAVAARIAERVLNEAMVTGQAQKSAQSGTVREGVLDFRWTLTIESSGLDTLRLATVQVAFPAQGRDYDVSLSTLVNSQ